MLWVYHVYEVRSGFRWFDSVLWCAIDCCPNIVYFLFSALTFIDLSITLNALFRCCVSTMFMFTTFITLVKGLLITNIRCLNTIKLKDQKYFTSRTVISTPTKGITRIWTGGSKVTATWTHWKNHRRRRKIKNNHFVISKCVGVTIIIDKKSDWPLYKYCIQFDTRYQNNTVLEFSGPVSYRETQKYRLGCGQTRLGIAII